MAALEAKSGGFVSFLSRRMFENYLLDPAAIAAVLSEELSSKVAVESVAAELSSAPQGTNLEIVHAAKVLDSLFWKLSEQRLQYSKVRHGSKLTAWLIENRPDALVEVSDLIRKKLQ